jgi:hypothetical protein
MERRRSFGLAVMLVAASFGLAACGERPQESTGMRAGKYAGKPDTHPWDGDPGAFSTGAFKRGDRGGWETAIRTRGENQNEYLRTR